MGIAAPIIERFIIDMNREGYEVQEIVLSPGGLKWVVSEVAAELGVPIDEKFLSDIGSAMVSGVMIREGS